MLKPDNMTTVSTLPSFTNTTVGTTTLTMSGAVLNGVTRNFVSSITYTLSDTAFAYDMYATNVTTNTKILLNNLLVMSTAVNGYSYKSTELLQMSLSWGGLGGIVIIYSVFNGTGADITLNTQTINFELVEYLIPF